MTLDHTYLTMRQSGFRPDLLYHRFRSIGLASPDAKILVGRIRIWINQCGVEWTIEHLKKVKQAYLNWMAGVRDTIPWLQVTKEGIPSNGFDLLRRYSHAKIVKAVNVYKAFLFIKIREGQRAKFLKALLPSDDYSFGMQGPKSPWVIASSLVYRGSRDFPRISEIGRIRSVAELPPYKPNGTFPTSVGNYPWNVVGIIKQTAGLFSHTSVLEKFPALAKTLPILPNYRLDHGSGMLMSRKHWRVGDDHIVGTVSCSQEPGGKLRHFASPFVSFQLALEPAKRGLFKALSELPQDATYNHENGVEQIQKALEAGLTCYSVDLSSATDRFPLDLQLGLLQDTELLRETQLLIHHLSRGRWTTSQSMRDSGYPDHVRWLVGQPLGLGPSFALFSLTHHALVRGIFHELGRPYSYVILGDDIVIWDEVVALRYMEVMNLLKCEVALDKTLVSNRVAEFAGQVIVPGAAYKSTKHKKISADNFIEYGALFGATSEDEICLSVDQISDLIKLLAPIPETVGGLGWNPDGLTLELRISGPVQQAFNALVSQEDKPSPGIDVQVLARDHLIAAGLGEYILDPSYGSRTVLPGQFETEGQRLVREDLIDQQRSLDLEARYLNTMSENAARRKRRIENPDRVLKGTLTKTKHSPSVLDRLRSLFGL